MVHAMKKRTHYILAIVLVMTGNLLLGQPPFYGFSIAGRTASFPSSSFSLGIFSNKNINDSIPFQSSYYNGSGDVSKCDCGYSNTTQNQQHVQIIFPTFFGNVPQSSYNICIGSNASRNENSVSIDPAHERILNVSNNVYGGGTDYFHSENAGITWSGDNLGNTTWCDPISAFNLTGDWYFGFLGQQEDLFIDCEGGEEYKIFNPRIFTKNNNVWLGPVSITTVDYNSYYYYTLDKPHLAIDNSMESSYSGYMYCGWTPIPRSLIISQFCTNQNQYSNAFQIEISTSTSNGVYWDNPIPVSRDFYSSPSDDFLALNSGVNIQTDQEGHIFAVWAVTKEPKPSLGDYPENALAFNSSINGGATFEVIQGRLIQDIHGIHNYSTWDPGGIKLNSFPSMCIDKSDGPKHGRIYIVWADQATSENGHLIDKIDIKLIFSDDQGLTWDEPIYVNHQETGVNGHSIFPWITCDPETGTLAVIFYDDRELTPGYINTYVALSKDYGQSWNDCLISDYHFLPLCTTNQVYTYAFGDYIGISSRNGMTYPVWTDSRLTEDHGNDNSACIPQTYISPFYTWNCVDNYSNISESVGPGYIREWEVSDFITARNTVFTSVNPNTGETDGGFVVFNAKNEIDLLPSENPNFPFQGFWGQNGSYVHAYLKGCDPLESSGGEEESYADTIPSKSRWAQNMPLSSQITIFPNPNNGKFALAFSKKNTENISLVLFSSVGNKVYEQESVVTGSLELDISGYPKGIYFLGVRTGDQNRVFKVVYNR
jgi:hypothetical protein